MAQRMQAEGWNVWAAVRSAESATLARAQGVTPIDAADHAALVAAPTMAAMLVTAPPDERGCPGLNALVPAIAQAGAFPDWIGYLSTTGVYGDREGGWVFEDSPLRARSPEAARRVAAERDWLEVGRGMGLTVQIFRLPGIYGPGRSTFDRLREGRARNLIKPGQVFSRIHVDDIVSGLFASVARPHAGRAYNLVDDDPAPPHVLNAFAAEMMGQIAPALIPYDETALPLAAVRFWSENKRVSNARAKAELGWRLRYPTWREGLTAIYAAENKGSEA
ncbi:NAD-dependent epimerase/dehydratase family protein [Caulobacter mirabilis]|uniref:NAD(P)-dependent oxidoreductase n=1 Tax=Caulobacter mirabilis TaxID=69666 RepID=A0A2D2B4D2_9CAUL|nr:NAD-dependent epimerase/dehydratase family protein [Caulobacter mirabilis]ATQ45078.1 NAD(P)-dependent oxidoreductase [Caulobacter mirabilis]